MRIDFRNRIIDSTEGSRIYDLCDIIPGRCQLNITGLLGTSWQVKLTITVTGWAFHRSMQTSEKRINKVKESFGCYKGVEDIKLKGILVLFFEERKDPLATRKNNTPRSIIKSTNSNRDNQRQSQWKSGWLWIYWRKSGKSVRHPKFMSLGTFEQMK